MDLRREAQKAFTRLHSTVFRATNGRLGGSLGKVESVLLTTTGRKSGATRTTPLAVVPDGDRLLLVASNGGAPKDPDWYLNLTANPDVTVQRGGEVRPMRARRALPDERPELWDKVVAANPGYAGYQRKTDREIPVVICEAPPTA